MQIDFSAYFDRVNHQGILYKLCSVSIESFVLSILTVSIKSITARYGGQKCFGSVIVPPVHQGVSFS